MQTTCLSLYNAGRKLHKSPELLRALIVEYGIPTVVGGASQWLLGEKEFNLLRDALAEHDCKVRARSEPALLQY